MKKVLGVLTLSVAMLVCATAAMAADNQGDIGSGCRACEKCALQNVPCPGEKDGVQGNKSVTGVSPFDYDDVYGYCPNQAQIDANGSGIIADDNKNGVIDANEVTMIRRCRLIFNVCDCPESCKLLPDQKVGIQMTILTPGVFWAEDKNYTDANYATIWFQNYKTYAEACAPATGTLTNVNNKDGRKDFGRINYYRSLTEKLNDKNKLERVLVGNGRPLSVVDDPSTPVDESVTGYYAGSIPPGNRVQVLESDRDYDYTITKEDEGRCQFWIDIPAMRLDGEAKKGDVIKVRVSLLTNRTFSGICSACEQPNICECIISVGVVCCETDSTSGCFFFPYVLQGLQESQGWVSGIAVSATGDSLPAGAYCKLTLKDQTGNIATWTKSDMGNRLVWAFVLDNIMPEFKKTMEPGACSLKVESNYPIDGYTFMNANMQFGTGTMPRACSGACNP